MGRFDLKINGENPLIVRRATLDDRDKIFDFIKIAYANWKKRIPERWYWQYIINPYVNKNELPIWIATDSEGNVIGQICAVNELMQINNTIYKIGWGIDFHVLSNYRGHGIGTSLLKAKDDYYNVSLSLGLTSAARRIRRSLGSKDASTMYSYFLQFSPNSLLNSIIRKNSNNYIYRFIKLTGLYKIMTVILNKWLNSKRKFKKNHSGDIKYITAKHFGKEVDALWEKVSSEFDCAIVRDSRYLNWKYLEFPNRKYNIFLSEIKGEIVGYIILRKKRYKLSKVKHYRGIIVDFLFSTANTDHLTNGINFAIDFFIEQGINDIRIATSVKKYTECIEKIGYPRPVFKKKARFKSSFSVDSNSILNAEWLLSYGDSNQQQFM